MNFDQNTIIMILGVLFGISEALTVIPGVKANGVFQLIFNILKVLTGRRDSQ